nr:MAG TPA: hypothetical protein [Caudoviricetes sp.]
MHRFEVLVNILFILYVFRLLFAKEISVCEKKFILY